MSLDGKWFRAASLDTELHETRLALNQHRLRNEMIRSLLRKKLPASRLALTIGLSGSLLALNAARAQQVSDPASSQAPETAPAERVVVTGSNIPTSEDVGEAPVDTVDQATRDVTGQEDVESVLLRSNPAISSGGNNIGSNDASTQSIQGASTITIHGLPTLILLNGRRLTDASAEAAGAGSFSDVNLFPSALVKRIEVLKDGASAIYGSEAIGGVVNVILDQDFNGFDFSARYGFTEKSDIKDQRFSGIVGISDDKTHFVIGAEYVNQDPVFNRDRDFSNPSFGTSYFGGAVRFAGGAAFLKNPGVVSPNDIYPVGSVAVPTAVGANPLPAAYTQNASIGTVFNLSGATTITLDQNRTNVVASGDRELIGKHVVAFVDFLYSSDYSQHYLNAQPLSTNSNFGVTIPYGSPYNPFNQTLDSDLASNNGTTVNNRFTALPRVFRDDTNFYRIVAGLKGEIIPDYNYEIAFNSSRDFDTFTNPNLVLLEQLDQGIAGGFNADGTAAPAVFNNAGVLVTPAGKYSMVGQAGNQHLQPALDFFSTGNSAAQLAGITGTSVNVFETKFQGVDGKITAFPFKLPAGPVGFAAGGEYRHEFLHAAADPAVFVDAAQPANINIGRDVFAGFGEVRIPIVGPDMKIPGVYSFDIDGAVRFENYSESGSDTVSKAGLTFRPIKDIALRGTYSASFIAPTLYQTNGPTTIGATAPVDLLGNGNEEQGNEVAGSNPNLSNTRADNYTAGIVLSPHQVPGLTANVDFFHVEEHGVVGAITAPQIFGSVDQLGAASPFAGLLHLGGINGPTGVYQPGLSPGHILAGNVADYTVSVNDQNLGGSRLSGLDFGLHYNHDFSKFGQVGLGVDGTYYLQYKTQTTSGTEMYDVIGFYQGGADQIAQTVFQYHLTPQVSYSIAGFTASAIGNYDPSLRDATGPGSIDPTPGLGGYNVDKNHELPKIRDYFTVDLLFSYEFNYHPPESAPVPAPKEGKDGKGGGKEVATSKSMASDMLALKLLDGLKVSFGIDDVNNARPPFIAGSADATNTDAGIYDPFQRRYYITLSKKF